jgi:hypothetical protein
MIGLNYIALDRLARGIGYRIIASETGTGSGDTGKLVVPKPDFEYCSVPQYLHSRRAAIGDPDLSIKINRREVGIEKAGLVVFDEVDNISPDSTYDVQALFTLFDYRVLHKLPTVFIGQREPKKELSEFFKSAKLVSRITTGTHIHVPEAK